MKKIMILFTAMILSISFSSCSSLVHNENRKNALELQNAIEQIIVPEKSTEFEVVDLLGNPAIKVLRGDGILRMAYYNGSFYNENIETNKKIIEKYVSSELLADKKALDKIVLAFYLKKDETKKERVVYKIVAEIMRN